MNKESIETVALIIGACIAVGGAFGWWVGKVLDLRKEIITLQLKMQFMEEKIKGYEKKMEDFEDWYTNGNK